MASTKMARNRKLKERAFKSLPWLEQQRLIEIKKHDMFLESLFEINKLLNHG